jgi:arylsulfatase A-like enzyme
MAELERLGIGENTIVMFTSDNGSRADFGPSNGVLRGRKGTTWEGGQRVPFIVRWPAAVPAGRVETGIASSIDILPTLASITGARLPDDRRIDGVDLSGLLTGAETKSPRETFVYYRLDTLEAVRSGDWKLHLRKQDEMIDELYNLREDPGETNNRFVDEPGRVAALMELVEAVRGDLGDAATGQEGDVRPIGRVPEGRTLTTFDPGHPYYMAEYDLADRG